MAIVDWFQGARISAGSDKASIRTVYNTRTQQYDEMPLSEFQHLLKQGKIEEAVAPRADGHPQRIYRLI